MSSQRIIVFKFGNEEYAIEIDLIKEVVLTPKIAKMPNTPDFVKGVANIRGNVTVILDVEEKFHLNSLGSAQNKKFGAYTIVIENQSYKLGILVDNVPDTLTIQTENIEQHNSTLQFSNIDEHIIKGVVKHDSRMIILIDIEGIMHTNEIQPILENH